MTRETIPSGYPVGSVNRKTILVALAPRAYRMVVGGAIQAPRPHLEVSSQPKPKGEDG